MAVFDHHEFAGHERVIHVADAASGLRAIIAIHDRTLGPAVGGCRVYPYATEADALSDVLRLSKGMTFKTALAGLPFGGAKSVIIADPALKSPQLIAAFGRAVNDLQGQYWTGEDVNFGPQDVETLAETTRYVLGRTKGPATSGDPSPFTAGGVFAAMKGALRHAFGSDDLAGRTVAIQGVGNVGFQLARQVIDAGGRVVATDVRRESTDRAAALGATIVDADLIYTQDCDVFAPCALGATISEATIPLLRSRIVCGAANNQLATAEAGQLLLDRNIAYVPDYVANAGGIINAFGDFTGSYDAAQVWLKVNAIGDSVERILDESQRDRCPTNLIADRMATEVIAAASNRRAS
jgi:leucine dehydrogenase